MAIDLFPLNPLTPRFLFKVLEERPNEGKRGYRQQYLQPKMAPFKDFYERNILLEKTVEESNIAGLYAPDGQALPVGDPLFSTMALSLQDVKSTRHIHPAIVEKIRDAGELALFNAGNTGVSKRNKAAIMAEIGTKMGKCDDDVDVTLEYFTLRALLGSIPWPPTDNDGSAVSNPPPHWNAKYSGTWTFPLPTEMNQDVASLVDYNGDAATAGQKKYWSDATADIIGQFRHVNQIGVENQAISYRNGIVIGAQSTLDLLAQNTAIKNFILGSDLTQTGSRQFVDNDTLDKFVKTNLGYTFMPYDAFFTYQTQVLGSPATKTAVRFLPKNKIIIIPPGGAGLVMGTAPIEHADEQWRPGKMPWSFKDPKPNYNREVGVNTIAWPVFTQEIKHFVLTVLA